MIFLVIAVLGAIIVVGLIHAYDMEKNVDDLLERIEKLEGRAKL